MPRSNCSSALHGVNPNFKKKTKKKTLLAIFKSGNLKVGHL